ncbi:MAG: glycosyltransferase [Burkholderiales bacterium]|nr:glycosyltransferase [Burkholderiales bacterium]
MKIRLPSFIIAGLLVVFFALAITQRPQTFYPEVDIDVDASGGPLTLSFLFNSRPTLQNCEALTGNIARVVLKQCPQCRVKLIQCDSTLDQTQINLLSNDPLSTPSGRMANGVLIFRSTNMDLALASCQATEKQSAAGINPVKCYPANTPRMKPDARSVLSLWSLVVLFAAFAAAWFSGWLIVKYEHLHAHLSHDHVGTGPQKNHAQPTPRIGGLAVMVGLLVAGGIMLFADALPGEREFGLLLIASVPAFVGGLVEDIIKKVSVSDRLLLTMLSGAAAAWLLGAALNRLGIPGVDQALSWLPFAVIFTIFAVGGIANAINIIDGYNGLATGFAIIVLAAMAFVAHLIGDNLIFTTALAMAGALFGFMAWNWPGGKIFLGDAGAYLLGFILAELSVLLVVRNPEVSPWFPLVLLIYPVFETFFSIYRRKFMQGLSAMQPDNKHLHQLIHDNVVPRGVRSGARLNKLDANNRVAKYIWLHAIVTAVLGCLFWQSTPVLIGIAIAYCVFYFVSYRQIVQWKAVPAGSRKRV